MRFDLVKNLLLIILVVLFGQLTNAQTITFKGVIINSQNQPLAGASVKLRLKDSTGLIKYFAIAKQDGSFELQLPEQLPTLWLDISMMRYNSLRQPFVYSTLTVTYQLSYFTGELPHVHVIAPPPDIKRQKDTTSYNVVAFAKGNEDNIEDLIKKLPGLSVDENGRLTFKGKSISRILMEGDDLTGSNYTAITRNISTNGLDKVDVIENYADQSKIENKGKSGSETVVNLKYKNRKLKLFGETALTAGNPFDRYEARLNGVSLIAGIKAVGFVNHNTIGKTAHSLLGKQNEDFITDDITNTLITNYAKLNAPARLYDIAPHNIATERVFFNKSTIANINTLFKAGKTLTIKPVINLAFDRYNQYSNNITTYNNPQDPLVIIQSNDLLKNNKQVNLATEINWVPTAKTQLALQYSFNHLDLHHTDNTLLSGVPAQQQSLQQSNHHLVQVKVTRLMSGKRTITTGIMFANHALSSNYNVVPPQPSVWLGTLNAAGMKQLYNGPSTTWAAHVQWSKWFKSSDLKITLLADNKRYASTQIATGHLTDGNTLPLLPLLNNQLNCYTSSISLRTDYTYNFSKLDVTATADVQQLYAKNQQGSNNSLQKLLMLPSLHLQYKPTDRHLVLLMLGRNVKIPSAESWNKAYAFTGINGLRVGNDSITINTGVTIGTTYMYLDPVFSGIIFYANLFYMQTPLQYLANQQVQDGYIILRQQLTSSNAHMLNLSTELQKTTHKRLFYSIGINGSRFSDYSILNNTEAKNNMWSGTAKLKWRTNWKSWFNIGGGVTYTYNRINTYVAKEPVTSYNNQTLLYNNSIELRFFQKLNIDLVADYLHNKATLSQPQHLFLADMKYYYHTSSRVKLGITLKNVFNNRSFVNNYLSNYNSSVTYFSLQSAMYLFTCSIKW